jgi:hypothetical protein
MAVLIVVTLHKPNRPLPRGVKVGKPHNQAQAALACKVW